MKSANSVLISKLDVLLTYHKEVQKWKLLTVKLDFIVFFTCQTYQADRLSLRAPVDQNVTAAAATRTFRRLQESAVGR